jgi:uncharacterized integral membrane protein
VKHLSWLITLPVTLVVVVFAVSNRTPVEIDLFPLPWRPVLPAYLLVLGSMFIGFLIGGIATWLAGAPYRRRARRLAAEAQVLSRELAEARRRSSAAAVSDVSTLPTTTAAPSSLVAARRA